MIGSKRNIDISYIIVGNDNKLTMNSNTWHGPTHKKEIHVMSKKREEIHAQSGKHPVKMFLRLNLNPKYIILG